VKSRYCQRKLSKISRTVSDCPRNLVMVRIDTVIQMLLFFTSFTLWLGAKNKPLLMRISKAIGKFKPSLCYKRNFDSSANSLALVTSGLSNHKTL